MVDDFQDRVRCVLIGSAIGESTSRLHRILYEPAYVETWADDSRLATRQIKHLSDLFRLAEGCGVEANGYLSGEFAALEGVSVGDRKGLQNAFEDFVQALHERETAAERGEKEL